MGLDLLGLRCVHFGIMWVACALRLWEVRGLGHGRLLPEPLHHTDGWLPSHSKGSSWHS